MTSEYNFTGSNKQHQRNLYLFDRSCMHLAHILVALISLLVVIYNHYKLKYKDGKTLGIELAATFWHFVDVSMDLSVFIFIFCEIKNILYF